MGNMVSDLKKHRYYRCSRTAKQIAWHAFKYIAASARVVFANALVCENNPLCVLGGGHFFRVDFHITCCFHRFVKCDAVRTSRNDCRTVDVSYGAPLTTPHRNFLERICFGCVIASLTMSPLLKFRRLRRSVRSMLLFVAVWAIWCCCIKNFDLIAGYYPANRWLAFACSNLLFSIGIALPALWFAQTFRHVIRIFAISNFAVLILGLCFFLVFQADLVR